MSIKVAHIIEENSYNNKTLLETNGTLHAYRFVEYPSTYPFVYSVIARSKISIAGFSTEFQSFDSTDSTKSTNGGPDPLKIQDNAYVVLSGSVSNSDYSTIAVRGNLGSQIGETAPDIGPTGKVGDNAWVGSQIGIQSGHFITTSFQQATDILTNNLYLPNSLFTPTTLPYTSGVVLSPVSTVYTIPNGTTNYTITGANTNTTLVASASGAHVVIFGTIPKDIIVATSCSLKVYYTGSATSINDITNTYQKDCEIHGCNSGSTITFTTATVATATVIAPLSRVRFAGGGSPKDFVGTVIADWCDIITSNWNFWTDESITKPVT